MLKMYPPKPTTAPTTSQIDGENPSLRGSQINYNAKPVTNNLGGLAGTIGNYGPAAQAGPAAGYSAAGATAGPNVSYQGVDTGAYKHDPNIDKYDTRAAAMDFWRSNMPEMEIAFRDESDALAKRTAAMGRTGSGVFNRDTGYISDRSRAARESMLGNIGFQAVTNDANRNTQADIAREGMIGQNLGMMGQLASQNSMGQLQAGMANQNNATQVSLANAAAQNQAGMFNAGQQNAMGQFNAAQQNALTQAGMGQDTARLGLMGQLMSQNTAIQNQHQMNQHQWLAQERGYQDMLANQAMQDRMAQINALLPGANFGFDPMSGTGDLAAILAQASGQFGGNAAMTNAGLSGLLSTLIPGFGAALSGGYTRDGGGGGIGGILTSLFGL